MKNEKIEGLINFIGKSGNKNGSAIWRDIAERLESPRKNTAKVNISHIGRYTSKNELVAVPGKVLGQGVINHSLTVAALSFSARAEEKIKKAGGRCLSFQEILEENPRGKKIKIIG